MFKKYLGKINIVKVMAVIYNEMRKNNDKQGGKHEERNSRCTGFRWSV